ncbi:PREDICTED: endoplasmic reticulum resident protein 27 [Thamnophis sirtalis]|uniref:Endoplasmic reticulum resident protein 27 n=1 Tax=Thamnophis sirtalis TaxID=35019 RepID=A0A6I9XSG4_9SAUR|nr:PREDICTED: endoplasmic reticulum resident protein 27 [Thamnophis sirtalis]
MTTEPVGFGVFFAGVFLSGVFLFGSGEKNSSSEDTIKEERKPVLLEDIPSTAAFIDGAEVAVVGFFETAVGLFDSAVQTHLLLFSDKTSPLHTERINKYREAAVAFQSKALFILVDISIQGNDRVLSYFHLKKSQLPALAAFYTADEEQDVLLLDEVSVERITDFCNAFLEKKGEVSIQMSFCTHDSLTSQQLAISLTSSWKFGASFSLLVNIISKFMPKKL